MNDDGDSGRAALNSVLFKGGLVLLGIALVIALGTWLVVRALGLNQPVTTAPPPAEAKPVAPLPSTALPVPHQKSDEPSDDATADDDSASHQPVAHKAHQPKKGFRLSASPVVVAPMERINLTGRYPGHDNLALQVQRLEGGVWSDFPTEASVQMGTFQTYVMSGHTGVNKFRVLDPGSGRASNVVSVTIRG